MPVPVESALATLLPTISLPPPELITLSNSLLAQSRNKAATLRPEEEIGRTYVCCHIACERLAKKLDLEIAKPVPPVKPRVYSKLKTWFETALRHSASNPTTPKTPGSRHRDLHKTPTSKVTSNRKVKPTETPLSVTLDDSPAPVSVLPTWTRSMVKALCAHFGVSDNESRTLERVNSIYLRGKSDAASTVQVPGSKRKRTSPTIEKDYLNGSLLPMLVAVVYASITSMVSGQPFETYYTQQRDKLLLFVMDYYDNNEQLFGDGPNATQIEEALEHWSKQAVEVWSKMEWWQDRLGEANRGRSDEKVTSPDAGGRGKLPQRTPLRFREKRGSLALDNKTNRAGLLPGLGTMFQSAVDWLSAERCAEYNCWKEDVLRDLAKIT